MTGGIATGQIPTAGRTRLHRNMVEVPKQVVGERFDIQVPIGRSLAQCLVENRIEISTKCLGHVALRGDIAGARRIRMGNRLLEFGGAPAPEPMRTRTRLLRAGGVERQDVP